ncbi:hypothetical protein C0J52_26495 [Blattella germanica]|nr:hypothetical protein C0J52_26495 [Blattella germanica]
MRHTNGQPCFNIHLHNHSGGTPLLVAVKAHGNGINCSRTLEFLIRQGANLTETERCGGMSALHIAIRESADPLIVLMLLKAASRNNQNLVNRLDYQKDTPLHYAHLRNDIDLQQQLKIINLLEDYGAVRVNGSQGKMPLTLVAPPERKEYIRANSFRRGRRS